MNKEETKQVLEKCLEQKVSLNSSLVDKCKEYGLIEVVPNGKESLSDLNNLDILDGESFLGDADYVGIEYGAKEKVLVDENGDRISYVVIVHLSGRVDKAIRVNLRTNRAELTPYFTEKQFEQIIKTSRKYVYYTGAQKE